MYGTSHPITEWYNFLVTRMANSVCTDADENVFVTGGFGYWSVFAPIALHGFHLQLERHERLKGEVRP